MYQFIFVEASDVRKSCIVLVINGFYLKMRNHSFVYDLGSFFFFFFLFILCILPNHDPSGAVVKIGKCLVENCYVGKLHRTLGRENFPATNALSFFGFAGLTLNVRFTQHVLLWWMKYIHIHIQWSIIYYGNTNPLS